MPHRRSRSTDSAMAALRVVRVWVSSTSATCTPIGTTGLSELIGS